MLYFPLTHTHWMIAQIYHEWKNWLDVARTHTHLKLEIWNLNFDGKQITELLVLPSPLIQLRANKKSWWLHCTSSCQTLCNRTKTMACRKRPRTHANPHKHTHARVHLHTHTHSPTHTHTHRRQPCNTNKKGNKSWVSVCSSSQTPFLALLVVALLAPHRRRWYWK